MSEYIQKIERDIDKIFPKDGKYAFLAGAGISMDAPSLVPSARSFVKELFKSYAPEEEIDRMLELDDLRYEFVVENVQNIFDKNLKFLDYLDLVQTPNIIHLFLAHMITKYHYVITTNFDYLIEIALKQVLAKQSFLQDKMLSIITEDDYKKSVMLKFPVIKVHGSKKDIFSGRSTLESLITTMSALGKNRESGKTFAIEPYKEKFINNLMFNRTLVILGYSGSDDFDIGPFLKEVKFMKKLVWIDHDSEINYGKEECFEYLSMENVHTDSSDTQPSKLDQLLLEIKSNTGIEVFKLKAGTRDLIKLNLFFRFLNFGIPEPKSEDDSKIPSFAKWMEERHEEAGLARKYRLAHTIYYFVGDFESAERTALKGLSIAQDKNEDLNQLFFLNALGLIYFSRSAFKEAKDFYTKALLMSKKLDLKTETIAININLGVLHSKFGEMKLAFQYLGEALNLTDEKTPALLKLTILNELSEINQAQGDSKTAITQNENAIKLAESIGDLQSKAVSLNNLAAIYISQGLLNPALTNAIEALKIHEELGDIEHKATTLNTIGNIYRAAGNYERALKYLIEAVQISRKINDLNTEALALNSIGVIHHNRGEFDKALNYYIDSLKITEKIGDLSGRASKLNNIGMVYRMKRDFNKALEYFEKSIEIAEELNEQQYLGVRHANRASVFEGLGQLEKALEGYQKALNIEKALGHQDGIAQQLINVGGILGDLGRKDETIRNYQDAAIIYERIGNKPGLANALNNLGVLFYKHKKDYVSAIETLEQAVRIYNEINNPNMANSTLQNLNFIRQKFEESKNQS